MLSKSTSEGCPNLSVIVQPLYRRLINHSPAATSSYAPIILLDRSSAKELHRTTLGSSVAPGYMLRNGRTPQRPPAIPLLGPWKPQDRPRHCPLLPTLICILGFKISLPTANQLLAKKRSIFLLITHKILS
jgi:hypothetical protein